MPSDKLKGSYVLYSGVDKLFIERFDGVFVQCPFLVHSTWSRKKEIDLLVNQSFDMELWYVAFHKTIASCSYFGKFVRSLVASMPYMSSNPLNMNCVVFC